MAATLSIGDFSKATHLSIKALRHYHELGVLEPAEVDPFTGYRRYGSDQIATAQVIRRLRDLDMPLDDIGRVLRAGDLVDRDRVISSHLERMQAELRRTQAVVGTLRTLLAPTSEEDEPRPEHVAVAATPAASITAMVSIDEAGPWWRGALAEIKANLDAQGVPATGTAGALLSEEFFSSGRGEISVVIPCSPAFASIGRSEPTVIPATELAVLDHDGSHSDIDLTYGALARYVAGAALAVDGPIREYYPHGPHTGAPDSAWKTRIGWPIFRTSARMGD